MTIIALPVPNDTPTKTGAKKKNNKKKNNKKSDEVPSRASLNSFIYS